MGMLASVTLHVDSRVEVDVTAARDSIYINLGRSGEDVDARVLLSAWTGSDYRRQAIDVADELIAKLTAARNELADRAGIARTDGPAAPDPRDEDDEDDDELEARTVGVLEAAGAGRGDAG